MQADGATKYKQHLYIYNVFNNFFHPTFTPTTIMSSLLLDDNFQKDFDPSKIEKLRELRNETHKLILSVRQGRPILFILSFMAFANFLILSDDTVIDTYSILNDNRIAGGISLIYFLAAIGSFFNPKISYIIGLATLLLTTVAYLVFDNASFGLGSVVFRGFSIFFLIKYVQALQVLLPAKIKELQTFGVPDSWLIIVQKLKTLPTTRSL